MPLFLCIETSTEVCSISLFRDTTLLAKEESLDGQRHSALATLMISKCLKKANINIDQLNAVAISKGPGSYTGLRVGYSIAKGICHATKAKLLEIDTLQALANPFFTKKSEVSTLIVPMIDARRMEVYASGWTSGGQSVFTTEALILDSDSFNEFKKDFDKIILCGNGAQKTVALFNDKFFEVKQSVCRSENLISEAISLYHKGLFAGVAYATPFYLKAPNITTPKKLV